MTNLLFCLAFTLFLVYIVISAAASKKTGLALYRHIIIRISLFAIPFAIAVAASTSYDIGNNFNIDTSAPNTEIDKAFWLFFVFPASLMVGMLQLIVFVVVFVVFGLGVAILWIIYAIARGVEKSRNKKNGVASVSVTEEHIE